MSLNQTPKGERIHIGIFGNRNVGKSSVMNAITNQDLAVISDIPGTTTDPVSKAMEILPLGPVLITDTPGFDDEGELGVLRIEKTQTELRNTDIAILVLDGKKLSDLQDLSSDEEGFIKLLLDKNLPYIICINKCDTFDKADIKERVVARYSLDENNVVFVSANSKEGIDSLKDVLSKFVIRSEEKHIIGDFIKEGDTIVLVVPIDESAPKGRLILPQQQVIRDALEKSATVVVTKDTELNDTLKMLSKKPKVVITDSQVFGVVSKIVPEDVYLTSFSILMSYYKGDLEWQVRGVKSINSLDSGARILISEGCTHHRKCADIGSVKIPKWLEEYTKKEFKYDFTSGGEFPSDLSKYDLVIHCGGCTLNEKEMKYRINLAKEQKVPITNYGVVISYINGILERSLDLLTLEGK